MSQDVCRAEAMSVLAGVGSLTGAQVQAPSASSWQSLPIERFASADPEFIWSHKSLRKSTRSNSRATLCAPESNIPHMQRHTCHTREGPGVILAFMLLAQGFELLLGSDVAYSLKALPSLFRAASLLLSKQSHSVFLLGYVSRSAPVLTELQYCTSG